MMLSKRMRANRLHNDQGAREWNSLPRSLVLKFASAGLGTFATLMLTTFHAKAQDVSSGERSFGKCRICHEVGAEAKNRIGPHLNKIFGRVAGSVEGYQYSPANRTSGVTWDDDNLAAYIRDPRVTMPGTKMAFAGIKNEKELLDLIAYLKSQ